MAFNKIIDIDYIDPKDINVNNVNDLIDKYFFLFWDNIFPDGYDYTTLTKVVRTTTFKSCMRFIYDNLFRTDPNRYKHASIINVDNIELLSKVCEKYLAICDLYNKQLGLMGFALLVGYDIDNVLNWGENPTSPVYCIYKSIRDHLRDSSEDCLKDSDIGRIAVANNSQQVGLNYGYSMALQQAAATVPKLENIASRYEKPPAISGD